MTKYILHGGQARRDTESNKRFFREIAKDLNIPVRVLIVCFAKDKSTWAEVFEGTKRTFIAAAPEKEFQFDLADENPDIFVGQVKIAHALYMLGGSTHMLKEYL